MWQQLLLNPFNKKKIQRGLLVIILGLLYCFNILAKVPSIPGPITIFEDLKNIQKNQLSAIKQRNVSNLKVLSNLDDIKNIQLLPEYISYTLLKASNEYINIMKGHECQYYAFLWNDLLKTPPQFKKLLPTLITLHNNKNVQVSLSKHHFFNLLFKKKCKSIEKLDTLFNKNNLASELKKEISILPKKNKQCNQVHTKIVNSLNISFLCKIPNQIQQVIKIRKELGQNINKSKVRRKVRRKLRELQALSLFYKNTLGPFQESYLENLCNNLSQPEQFCNLYLTNDTWTKVINHEYPLSYMLPLCEGILRKKPSSNKQTTFLKNCQQVMKLKDASCATAYIDKYPALVPRPLCSQIKSILPFTSLKQDYKDCPGNIDNEAISNVHRILQHYYPRTIRPTQSSCATETNYTFSEIYKNINKEKTWPFKICYNDPIIKKNKCLKYIPGEHKKNKLSQTKIIAKILGRFKSTPQQIACRIVDSNTYRPELLEYKHDCFIVFNQNNCTPLSCKRKIYYRTKEYKGINYKGTPTFDYFPTSFSNEHYALKSILELTYKLRPISLKNLTQIKFFFRDNKIKNIAHGLGCAEDLLPRHFRSRALNECTIIPFIIENIITNNEGSFFITRLAIDDLQSPRKIPWKRVYNALKNYQKLQPLKLWPLEGLKKK